MSKVLLLLAGMMCAWLGLGAQAYAEPSASEYEDAIRRAIEEFDAGHWEEARALFRRAHEISPNARTWRGLGITAFELRRYVDAVSELEAALANPLKPLTDKQREELQGLLVRVREFVSTYHITLVPAGASLLVDGQPAELRDGELLLDPGAHALLVRAPGYQDRHAELRADAGQREQLSIELPLERSQAVEATGEPAPAPLPTRSEPAPRVRRVVTWSLAGAAAGALVAGGVLGLVAKNTNEAFHACDDAGCDSDQLEEHGKRQALGANVMFGLGGGVALSAVVAYFLEGRRQRTHAALLLEPGGVVLTGSFAF